MAKSHKNKQKKTSNESLTYRAAKRLAVSLGMPFPDACTANFSNLVSYAASKVREKPDNELIVEYDKWMDKQLELRGYDEKSPLRHYQLRLSYISEGTMDKAPRLTRRVKKEKVLKPKREKDESGLWKGTKKSYTFELTNKGYSLDRVTRRVLKKFPDANEASIKQWWKKANKLLKDA